MRMYRFAWHLLVGVTAAIGVTAGALFAPTPIIVLVVMLAIAAGIMAVCSPATARRCLDHLTSALRNPPHAGADRPEGDTHADQPTNKLTQTAVPLEDTDYGSSLRARLGLGGADPNPAQWTDEQLCWAWRASFTKVRTTRYPFERQSWATERGRYLDELQRRDRAGFARWMASGARAGSNPARYLSPTQHPSPPEHSDQ